MISFLVRVVLGVLFFEIGLFWACVVVFGTLIGTLCGGKKAIIKFFNRKKHDNIPEVALAGYDHDYVRTRSGMRFHYVHAGDAEKPLMLCVHGFPECWYSWKHMLKRFSDDYHVVAVDMRGYGDSDKPNSAGQYHISYMVRDVHEIVRALGYQNAVIVGHDWGSVIVWEVARFYPETVSKLITMSIPPLGVIWKFLVFSPIRLLKSWYIFFYQVPWLPEIFCGIDDYDGMTSFFKGEGPLAMKNEDNFLSDDEIEVYKNATCRNITYGINYYRGLNPIYSGLRLKPKSKQVTTPVLLIWGTEDPAVDIDLVNATKKAVTHLKTEKIEGASHWVQLDKPDEVVAAINKFLKD